jgi:hypothetical protein
VSQLMKFSFSCQMRIDNRKGATILIMTHAYLSGFKFGGEQFRFSATNHHYYSLIDAPAAHIDI